MPVVTLANYIKVKLTHIDNASGKLPVMKIHVAKYNLATGKVDVLEIGRTAYQTGATMHSEMIRLCRKWEAE
jgi:hypothetical protein